MTGSTGLQQIGFVRIVTDYVTFAWADDSYILPEYRHQGLGGWLECCVAEALKSWEVNLFLMVTSEELLGKYSRLGVKPWISRFEGNLMCAARLAELEPSKAI